MFVIETLITRETLGHAIHSSPHSLSPSILRVMIGVLWGKNANNEAVVHEHEQFNFLISFFIFFYPSFSLSLSLSRINDARIGKECDKCLFHHSSTIRFLRITTLQLNVNDRKLILESDDIFSRFFPPLFSSTEVKSWTATRQNCYLRIS